MRKEEIEEEDRRCDFLLLLLLIMIRIDWFQKYPLLNITSIKIVFMILQVEDTAAFWSLVKQTVKETHYLFHWRIQTFFCRPARRVHSRDTVRIIIILFLQTHQRTWEHIYNDCQRPCFEFLFVCTLPSPCISFCCDLCTVLSLFIVKSPTVL